MALYHVVFDDAAADACLARRGSTVSEYVTVPVVVADNDLREVESLTRYLPRAIVLILDGATFASIHTMQIENYVRFSESFEL